MSTIFNVSLVSFSSASSFFTAAAFDFSFLADFFVTTNGFPPAFFLAPIAGDFFVGSGSTPLMASADVLGLEIVS